MDIKFETRTETCERHGSFHAKNLYGKIWSKCPACATEQHAAEEAAAVDRAEAEKLAAWQKRIGSSGIPERFNDRTLATYRAESDGQRRALAFSIEYANNFDQAIKTGRSALFVGQPGTGKTHLAVGIGLHVLAQRRPVLFTTVMRALRRVKDSWVKGSEVTESQVIESLVYPDLLILDEVGVQTGSEFERNALFDVLNERYERRRPVLLLSNAPFDELKQYLGERVLDRLREDGGKRIPFDWQSHRGGSRSTSTATNSSE
jgi:DNA replication protein DnaC